MRNLTDWKPGVSSFKSASHHQEAVDALRELGGPLVGNAGGRGSGHQWRLGKIVDKGPAGQADKADARYWVQWSVVADARSDAKIALANDATEKVQGDSPGNTAPITIVAATNLAEWATDGGTHLLKTDGTLAVFAIAWIDVGSDGNTHYLFDRPAPKRGLFPVTVSQTGGSAGNQTAACSFTYSATDPLDAGASLGTGLSPTWARPSIGTMTAATHGTGYMDSSGTFVLYQVDEVPSLEACTEPP